MAETVRLVDYYYVVIGDKPGEGERVLRALQAAGANLAAVHGFPAARRVQLDLVPTDPAAMKAALKQAQLKATGPKKAFLIDGDDRVGVLVESFTRLARAGVNVTAATAVTGGAGRFGAILWVKPRDVKTAAKALGAG